jgi:hypothetical protein
MFLCTSSTVFADSGPKAVMPQLEYNFGSVPQGQKVEHEFLLRNEGDAELVIQRLAPSCGCTAAAMSSSAVKPGGSEKIKVAFNTAGFYGDKTKSVHVLTNSRDNPELVIKMTGHIVRGVAITPAQINFGEVPPSAPRAMRTKEFSVEIVDDIGREIAAVKTFSKALEVTPLDKNGKTQRYSVMLLPEAQRGELRDRVIVEFKNPDHAAINVPVIGTIPGQVRVAPSMVSFGIIDGTQPIERRVRFENNSGQPIAIQGVSSSNSAVTTSVVDVEPGKRWVIVVTLDPTKVSGDLKSTIEVKTSHPEESLVSIGVFGVQPPR